METQAVNEQVGGLRQVAQCMKALAGQRLHGQAYRRLARGLHLVYGNQELRYRLAVGRLTPAAPSAEEIEIVRTAFGVPAGAGQEARVAQWWDPVEERAKAFNVVELTWTVAHTLVC